MTFVRVDDAETTAPELAEPSPAIDAPHDGWTQLPPQSHIGLGCSFVSGDPTGPRLRVAYFMRDVDKAIVGRVWYGPLAQGPPKHAHGGATASLLDEAMGAAGWLAGHRVVAAKIEIAFKRPIALGTTCTFEAAVTKVDGRRVEIAGALALPDGSIASVSSGLYIVVDIDKLRASAQ